MFLTVYPGNAHPPHKINRCFILSFFLREHCRNKRPILYKLYRKDLRPVGDSQQKFVTIEQKEGKSNVCVIRKWKNPTGISDWQGI